MTTYNTTSAKIAKFVSNYFNTNNNNGNKLQETFGNTTVVISETNDIFVWVKDECIFKAWYYEDSNSHSVETNASNKTHENRLNAINDIVINNY